MLIEKTAVGGESVEGHELEATNHPRPDQTIRAKHILALLGATGVALVWTYRLWNFSPRRPIVYAGDALAVLGHVETVDRSGWWWTNDQWGWPFGLEHYDFPFGGDQLHILTIRILGMFSDDAVLLTNAFFFGTFFMIALVCFLVLRHLRISPLVAGGVAILFTFLPFHFWHGTPHLYRSAYYLVPVAGLILLWLTGHDGGFFENQVLRRRRLVFAVGVSVLLAMSDTVAIAFPMTLAAAIGVLAFFAAGNWRVLLVGLGLAGVMASSLLVNNLPTLLYQANNGDNPITLQRVPSEQERYGLKVASLVLPQPDHPIGALGEIGDKPYADSLIRSEGGQSLGSAGTFGLIVTVVALFGAALGVRRGSKKQRGVDDEGEELLRRCGTLNVVAVLIGVPTGLAFVLSIFGLEEFRTWNRIVIYIGFFSLVGLGVVLDRFRCRFSASGVAATVVMAGMVLLFSVAVWDQTPRTAPAYRATAEQFNSDGAFFEAVEAMYPDGGQIFALPVIPYPEPEHSEAQGAYRHMIAILHTTRLDTSYGGMKGREWEWQRGLARLPSDLVVKSLVSAGFDGIYVDRWNYEDQGAAVESALTDAIGASPNIEAANGAFLFWDLRPVLDTVPIEERELLGEEITLPVVAMLDDGFYSKARSNALSSLADETARILIRNMSDKPHEVVVSLVIGTAGGTVSISGGGEWQIDVGEESTNAWVVMVAQPGDTPIELLTDGASFQSAGDPREIHMRVSVSVTGPLMDVLSRGDVDQRLFPAFSR